MPKEEVKVRKVKKAIKHAVKVGSAEAQNGGMPEETAENSKVERLPQKPTALTNGEKAATPSPDSESKKKKKKKKRKMANDTEPGRFVFFDYQLFR